MKAGSQRQHMLIVESIFDTLLLCTSFHSLSSRMRGLRARGSDQISSTRQKSSPTDGPGKEKGMTAFTVFKTDVPTLVRRTASAPAKLRHAQVDAPKTVTCQICCEKVCESNIHIMEEYAGAFHSSSSKIFAGTP